MAIKCSLLGHKFTESDVEKEREEQGSEVLTTIKEIESCERCGKQRVVSENKEVTALDTSDAGDEGETSDDSPAAETPAASTETAPTPDIDAAEDDAELIESAEDDDPSETAAEPPTATDDGGEEPTEAADDDAVILEDDDQDDRSPGEWPDDDEPNLKGERTETTNEPPADETSATTEEKPATEEWPDEYGHEDPNGAPPEVEWPEENRDSDDDWEASERLTEEIDGAEIERAGAATITVPEGEFECPECGFRTSVESSSLRAGDFCPDCHRGTLEHLDEEETRKE